MTGTVNMADASIALMTRTGFAKVLIAVLFISGFGTKAAIAPFHAWLPDAHPAAPAPISAMLSGILIKSLGVYALIRILYNILGMTYPISMVLTALAVLSILGGSFLAIGQWDMKRLLACSSISQVGYIILGLGLATPMGVMGGLFHLFNHAIIKPLLFMSAGAVEYATGTRQMKDLGGLRQNMPVTANTSLIASLALSGIPPFNGFWSKLFIILACVQAGRLWLAIIAVIGSILTLAYLLRAQKYVFFGPSKHTNIVEVPFVMCASMIVLALICVLTGLFFPFVLGNIINPAVAILMNGTNYSRMISGGL
jgi:multicomponent Na+:H+ antiporter subunit D